MKESLEEEPKGEPEKNPFAKKSRPSFIKDASEKLKKKQQLFELGEEPSANPLPPP